jgi:hypothetical protein
MLGGPTVKQLWELTGQQHSIRRLPASCTCLAIRSGSTCGPGDPALLASPGAPAGDRRSPRQVAGTVRCHD